MAAALTPAAAPREPGEVAAPDFLHSLFVQALAAVEAANAVDPNAANARIMQEAQIRDAERLVATARVVGLALPDEADAILSQELAPVEASLRAALLQPTPSDTTRALLPAHASLTRLSGGSGPLWAPLLVGPVIVWTNQNMGADSGLDADTLDGVHASDIRLWIDLEIGARRDADARLEGLLDAERAARIAADAAEASARAVADNALGSRIDDETAARIAGDSALQGAVDAEAAARSAADSALDGRISQEVADRAAGDSALQNALNAESQARADGDSLLRIALNDEIAARVAAIQALQNLLDAETAGRIAVDSDLADRVDQEISDRAAGDAAEAAARMAGDSDLQDQIDSQTAAFQAALDAETQARMDGDSLLRLALDDEIAARAAAIQDLQDRLAAESLARADADTALDGRISSEVSTLNGRIDNVASTINARIDSEVAAIEAAIASEEQARMDGDSLLRLALDDEIADRIAAIADLQTQIDAEAAARASADDALDARIDQEIADRQAATTGSQNALDQEIADRIAGDDALQAALASEAAARTAADDALDLRASALEGRATSLEGRAAAVESRATALEGRATGLESYVNGGAFSGSSLSVSGDVVARDLYITGTSSIHFPLNPFGGAGDGALIFVQQDAAGTDRTSLVLRNDNDGPGASADAIRLQGATIFVEPNSGGGGHLNVAGVVTGDGSGLSNLNAANLAAGTVSDARLSTNVMLRNAAQTVTGAKTFDGGAERGTAGFFGMGPDLSFTGGQDDTFYLNNVGGAGGRTSISYMDVERFTVENGGDVGIGTTDPSRKLDVVGTGRFTGLELTGANALEFGQGVAGKHGEAGKITYGGYGAGILHIVGGGATAGSRTTKLWDDVLIAGPSADTGSLDVDGPASADSLVARSSIDAGTLVRANAGGAGGLVEPWMTVGFLGGSETDGFFLGLKDEGFNRKDTVLAFGDDANDNFRVMYSPSGPAIATDVAKFESDGDFLFTGRLVGGTVPWARLGEFPPSCGADEFVRNIAETFTCGTYDAGSGLERLGTLFRVKAGGVTGSMIASGQITDSHVASGAGISWSKISKAGSSLADLGTRSAGDLNSGTLADARLSANVALLSGPQTFTGSKTFANQLRITAVGTSLLLSPNAMGSGEVVALRFADPDGGTAGVAFEYVDDGSAGVGLIGGSLGIGLNNPQKALDVVGTARADAFTWQSNPLGTCDASTRLQTQAVAGGPGQADVLYMCMKSAADTYAWRAVVSG